MALKPPTPGLRRLRNFSNDIARVQVVVPSGDELEVSEEVAAQLPQEFRPVDWQRTTAEPSAVEAEPEPTIQETVDHEPKSTPLRKGKAKKSGG